MRKILSFFMVLISMFAFSQKTITGVIKNGEGPVASASVTVEEPGKDGIIAYTISNAKGEYKLTFTTTAPTVDVKIKAFNHKTQHKTVSNENQTLNVSLDAEATEIKEVKLKTKIITKRGDTITYDLKAFESKSDRTVADVLKKMPGIEVNKDGTVLYKGEPISKYYVNGKDLMEGGYGTINNSLPKDAVQKVEVLENHQPVKVLQDKVPSEQAAINIKLKNKVTMTGRGEAGSGFGNPWLWNLKLTPMFFGQKNQWVVNYKTNNTGETVENEGNMLAFGNRWEGRRVQANQNDWLNVESAATPPLPEKRYLMNNVHFLSANLLTTPFQDKGWELKANASYTNNVVKREDYSESRFIQTGKSYVSTVQNLFYTNKAKGEIIFSKNAKKNFFKNTTTFSQFWNADRAFANRNDMQHGERHATEEIESPSTNFQNSLSTIIPWKEKLINVMSYLHYQTDRQSLAVSPASYLLIPTRSNSTSDGYFNWGTATSALQDFNMRTFEANHSANVSFISKGWTFTPEIGFNYTSNAMKSLLSGDSANGILFYGDHFRNDLKYSTASPYAAVGINYKSDAWQLYSNIPVNFVNINVEDQIRNATKKLSRITVEPNFFAQYSFASFWKAGINGSNGYSFGDINDVYAGNILTSPSRFSAMDLNAPIVTSNRQSLGARIDYRNPLNNLFFNVSYRLGWNSRNLTPNIKTDGLGNSTVEYLDRKLKSDSRGLSAEIGKYFPKFKTNTSVGYSNSVSNSAQMLNSELQDTQSNSQGVNFKFNNTYFEWMSVDYNMSWNWARRTLQQRTQPVSTGYSHNLAFYFYPLENHTIGFNWDQISSKFLDRKFNNPFYDLYYQYTWARKKIDFELKLLNIANRKLYENYTLGTVYETYSKIQLRPRQLMFTVKFNFK